MNSSPYWLRHPQVTLLCTAMLFAAGVWALLKMPRREDPKITVRVGVMALLYPGATSEQVEQQVTKYVEERLFRYPEVRKEKTFSTSRPGFCFFNIELEEWVKRPDLFWSKLRHDLLETRASRLPPGVIGPMLDTDFGDTIAVLLALHGGDYGYRELKDYAERVEEALRSLRPAAKVKRYGEQKERIYVTSTLERLAQYRVPITRVVQALQGRNVIQFGGRFEAGSSKLPITASALFETPEQIGRVMVDVSPTGQPVYIGDVARVERRYQDPEFVTRFNGERALMISVEMQEGYNIVEFGRQLTQKLAELRPMLPPDLRVDLLANQPLMVQKRIASFLKEFGIAIVSVILVTMILLPFHVALVAAIAIPVTVSVTFALLYLAGIELQQVSISMLVVMLGILVDDAIVVADNYVDLLDRGQSVEYAAAHCAREIFVPVLVATATIIAAFLPNLFTLTGSVGEFIFSMPVVVAISLSVSFAVAFFLTPLLCRRFIRRGLRAHEGTDKPKFSLVGLMERGYAHLSVPALNHRYLACLFGLLTVIGGVLLLRHLPQRFFPPAEREQFVIDVWLPEGYNIHATGAVVSRIEQVLRAEPLVANYGSFLGFSAPRFYYNVDPQQPAENYGQILVNTKDVDRTPALVYALRKRLRRIAPEAFVIVKELQQGDHYSAPIEVRFSGENLSDLKALAAQAAAILRSLPGAEYVHTDWREDAWQLRVDLNQPVANRLGFTNASVARSLAGSFEGIDVTTFWEGSRAVDVVLRLDESRRRSFDNVRNAYLTSPVTGAKVPLRQLGALRPEWETSRIVRRNGVRTITVRSFFKEGVFASDLVRLAKPRIEAIPLPRGYNVAWGGEKESQESMTGGIVTAAVISGVLIFLILVFQFHAPVQALVVMSSIPLSFFGAAVGLLIIGMPFSFVAQVGLIGVGGVVVRNSILLVDYINERRRAGEPLMKAAREAGARRLRPIFLTTMAAAVGVTPMILSGSLMWAPMAAVIAFGLIFSMFFTLLVVPALYVVACGRGPEGGAQ